MANQVRRPIRSDEAAHKAGWWWTRRGQPTDARGRRHASGPGRQRLDPWFGAALASAALAGCATAPAASPDGHVLAAEIYESIERGQVILIDVRSAAERARGVPRVATVHIQFGPDRWTGSVDDADAERFAVALRSAVDQDRTAALLCDYGVRSAAAMDRLNDSGVRMLNVRDGYRGNVHGPGWRAWE